MDKKPIIFKNFLPKLILNIFSIIYFLKFVTNHLNFIQNAMLWTYRVFYLKIKKIIVDQYVKTI